MVKSKSNIRIVLMFAILYMVLFFNFCDKSNTFNNSNQQQINHFDKTIRQYASNLEENTYLVFISDQVDSLTNKVRLVCEFSIFNTLNNTPPPPSGRNFCSICILSPDSIIVWGKLLKEHSEFKKTISEYYNHLRKTEYFGPDYREIKLLGKVETTMLVFEITINSNSEKGINVSSLQTLLRSINSIFAFHEALRDKYSNKFFNKPFNELKFFEKTAIISYCSIDIRVIFNSRCGIIMPPPP